MNKKLLLLSIFTLTQFVLPLTTSAVYFPDVEDTHTNSESINWMKENEVIEGYDDGTFKPENRINRAELLKIIIEGFDFPTDVNTSTGFPDIDESAWYGKYVRKAKSLDWIEGYPDGTFKPDQPVNKAETLKILGKVKDWQTYTADYQPFDDTPLQDWYTPYVTYSKNKNFLEETGNLFSPGAFTTRAKFSEMVYRIIAVEQSGANEYYDGLTPDTIITSNIEPKLYDEDFFNGLTLTEKFPNIFYENEIYTFEGTLENNKNNCFAYIALEHQDTYETYLGSVANNICKITVTFSETGIQNFGIIPDLEGYNEPAQIEVVKNLPTPTNKNSSDTPQNHEVKYSDNQTSFSFNNNNNDLVKINFTQNGISKTFFSRQNLNEISIPYKYFENFSEGQMKWSVEGAKSETTMTESDSTTSYTFEITSPWTKSTLKTFIAAPYHIQILEDDKIEYNNFSDTAETNQIIEITGFSRSYIEKTGYIITPDGYVEDINIFSDSQITNYYGKELYEPYNDFNLTYTPNQSGAYLLEINDENGVALFNGPIYVGNIIPLIPDFFTTTPFAIEYNLNVDLDEFRNKMLASINSERSKINLPTLSNTETLNNLAQSHSEDMVENHYFAHISPDGKSPDDRRIEAGIPMQVSENLVKSVNLEYAHESLMRSAAHRKNIISENWSIVGIGIALDEDGYLVITQEFSIPALTSTDLMELENDLISDINNLRLENDKETLTIDNEIDQTAVQWSEKMNNEDFFSFESPSGESLLDSIDQESGEFSFIILEGTYQSDFFNLALDKENTLISSLWSNFGVGFDISEETGFVKVTIIFST